MRVVFLIKPSSISISFPNSFGCTIIAYLFAIKRLRNLQLRQQILFAFLEARKE